MAHTPTPWEIGEDGDVFAHGGCACVAQVCGAPEGIEECEANAAFIVKAVNNHRKLTRALIRTREILDSTAKCPALGRTRQNYLRDAASQARATLADVEASQ